MPRDSDEEPERRTVAPRSAVGATAWTSKGKTTTVSDDDDGWEDIVAPDDAGEHTPVEGLSLVTAPPPPPLLPSTPTPLAMVNPLLSAPPSSLSSSSSEPASPAAAALARDLGLSDDELALALSAHDDGGDRVADTIVDAANADEGGPLARSIAAQLGDDSDAPRPLPPELRSDVSRLDADGAADARDVDGGDTDKGKKKPPTPTPQTSTPSSAPTIATTATTIATTDAAPASSAAAANDELARFESIHERRTQLDIEGDTPAPSFGISRAQAAAVFVVGFVGVAGLVAALSGGKGEASVDTGVEVVSAIVDAGSVAPVVVDAVDAGASAATIVDAGAAAVVVDAGAMKAPNATPNTTPNTTPTTTTTTTDPQAEYTKHLKTAEAFAKKGDFGKSVRSYKAALAVDKDALAAHLGLGNAYYELDNLEASLFHLERARALAPSDPQVFVLLGTVYQSAGRKADAIGAYQRYLELAPDGKFSRDVKGILRGLNN